MSSIGKLLNVDTVPAGDELVTDSASGATSIRVDDAYDFLDQGGFLQLGDDTTARAYTAVDFDSGTIVLATGLPYAVTTGLRIAVLPPQAEKVGTVLFADDQEPVMLPVVQNMWAILKDGIRSDSDQETVRAEQRGSRVWITEVIGRPAVVNGGDIDTTNLKVPTGSDGLAPTAQPSGITTQGGVRSIFVTWQTIANPDPVTYDVWIGTDPVVVPDYTGLSNRAGSIIGTNLTVRSAPGGGDLAAGTTYYVTVTARDADGPSTGSVPPGVTGNVIQITSDDIAAEQAWFGSVSADRITGGQFQADMTVSGTIQTADSGQRTVIDGDGIRQYRADGSPGTNLPNAGNPVFAGDILAENAVLTQGVEIQGTESFVAKGASVTLQSGVVNPTVAPTMDSSLLYWGTLQTIPGSAKGTDRRALRFTAQSEGLLVSYWDGNPNTSGMGFEWINLQSGVRNTYKTVGRDPGSDNPTHAEGLDMVLQYGTNDVPTRAAILDYSSSTGWRIKCLDIAAIKANASSTADAYLIWKVGIGSAANYPISRSPFKLFPINDTYYGLVYKRSDGKLHVNYYYWSNGTIVANGILTTGTYSQAIFRSAAYFYSTALQAFYLMIVAKWAGTSDVHKAKFFKVDLNTPQPETTSIAIEMEDCPVVDYAGGKAPAYMNNTGLIGLSPMGYSCPTWADTLSVNDAPPATFAYTWYDDDSAGTGTHESMLSKTQLFLPKRGLWTTFKSGTAPSDTGAPDDVNAVRFYVARGASNPARSKFTRAGVASATQLTPAPSIKLGRYNDILPAGTADASSAEQPPTENGFLLAASSPAFIRSTVDDFVVYGDGSGKWTTVETRAAASGAAQAVTQDNAVLRLGAAASLANNAWTTFTAWATSGSPAVPDELNGIAYNSSSGLLVVQKAGLYAIRFVASYTSNSTGVRGVRPIVNGSAGQNILDQAISGFQTTVQVNTEIRLAAGATVGFQGFQNSGAALNVLGDSGGLFTRATLRRVRL